MAARTTQVLSFSCSSYGRGVASLGAPVPDEPVKKLRPDRDWLLVVVFRGKRVMRECATRHHEHRETGKHNADPFHRHILSRVFEPHPPNSSPIRPDTSWKIATSTPWRKNRAGSDPTS